MEAYEELEARQADMLNKALAKQKEEMEADKRKIKFLTEQLGTGKVDSDKLLQQVRMRLCAAR